MMVTFGLTVSASLDAPTAGRMDPYPNFEAMTMLTWTLVWSVLLFRLVQQ